MKKLIFTIIITFILYSFSQQNNDEMGIHVTKENDADLYSDIYDEVQRLLTISEEIRVTVKKVDKEIEKQSEKTISEIVKTKDHSNSKLLMTKELSELTGLSSRKVNSWFVDKKLMYKKDNDWHTTKQGKEIGGIEKTNQYGKFVVWPEDIAKHITE